MTLTEQQIETLAFAWPWDYEDVEKALRLAEDAGWPLDDTVRGLDRVAEEFGDEADPALIVGAAIEFRKEQSPLRDLGAALNKFLGPS